MLRLTVTCALLAAALSAPISSTLETEYLALVPQPPYTQLKWVSLSYDKDVSSSTAVDVAFLNASVPEIGSWYDLDMKFGAQLSAKILGDSLYALIQKNGGVSPEGGCCADTLRVFSKADGSHTDVDLDSIVTKAMPAGVDPHVSHTFDVKMINGKVVAFANVLYTESRLDGVYADAIVAFDVANGEIFKTADGDSAFIFLSKAGETLDGHDSSAAIFKIQYFNGSLGEEWHGNGVEHFVTKDGTSLLAVTHRMLSEAVIFKSPFVYPQSAGGGAIRQRFGTPTQYTAKTQTKHYFGVKEDGAMGYITGGVHNVWYRKESQAFPGQETVSMFVNTASNTQKAYAIEFVLRLQEEELGVTYNDTVFATDYKAAELSFSAQAQGGARAIGNGVLLAMSGVSGPGLEVADVAGHTKSYQYPTSYPSAPNLYDPFCFVMKSS